jgi:hypothetical protein
MAQRGRRSAASLLVVPNPIEAIPRRRAPAELTREQAEVWDAVVASQPADWFNKSQLPILIQYCRHVIRARRCASQIEAVEASMAEAADRPDADRMEIMLSGVALLDACRKCRNARAAPSQVSPRRCG